MGGELEPQHNIRPMKDLSEEELSDFILDLQAINRETAGLYEVAMQERTFRYLDRLSRYE